MISSSASSSRSGALLRIVVIIAGMIAIIGLGWLRLRGKSSDIRNDPAYQRGVDAVTKYPGWTGGIWISGGLISVTSFNEQSDYSRMVNRGFEKPLSLWGLGIDNEKGTNSISAEPTSLRVRYADGTIRSALPASEVRTLAKKNLQESYFQFSQGVTATPGSKVNRLVFFPVGLDSSNVVAVILTVNQRDEQLSGKYLTPEQKRDWGQGRK